MVMPPSHLRYSAVFREQLHVIIPSELTRAKSVAQKHDNKRAKISVLSKFSRFSYFPNYFLIILTHILRGRQVIKQLKWNAKCEVLFLSYLSRDQFYQSVMTLLTTLNACPISSSHFAFLQHHICIFIGNLILRRISFPLMEVFTTVTTNVTLEAQKLQYHDINREEYV